VRHLEIVSSVPELLSRNSRNSRNSHCGITTGTKRNCLLEQLADYCSNAKVG
jgi:hypothetical protein